MGLWSAVSAGVVFEVIRACLAGGSEEDEENDDNAVPLLSWSLVRLEPRHSFALVLALAFSFAIFSDIESVAAARSVFSGHVAVLVEEKFSKGAECARAEGVRRSPGR